jgi:hypothetical protein
MYAINISFKDILHIGTADSSFYFIWTSLVHGFVSVYVHSSLSFTSAHFVSFTDLSASPGSQLLCRCPVTAPTSFFGPHILAFTGPPLRISFRSGFHAPVSFTVCPSSVLLSSVIPLAAFPFVRGSTDLSRSPFPTSSVLHRFPLPLLFSSCLVVCNSVHLARGWTGGGGPYV